MSDRKVVLITGGTRGIGKAIAKKFAANNYDLVLNYLSDKTDIEMIKKEFEEYNVLIEFERADVTDFDQCKKMIDNVIKKLGRVDVLVNNSGITRDTLLLRMKEDDFSKVIDTNLKGTFNVTKNVVTYMLKQKYGKIVNISSVVGISGNVGQANYAASKAGIIGFTKSIAKELASRNILVNAVAPGFIDTDMTSVLSDKVKETINSQIPLKKMGKAEDVANLVYFLSSEESSYITGQVINVDGGMLM